MIGRDTFSAQALFLGPSHKTGCVTLFHCSWRSAWCQICDIRVVIACGIHSWLKKFVVMCLNKLVHIFPNTTYVAAERAAQQQHQEQHMKHFFYLTRILNARFSLRRHVRHHLLTSQVDIEAVFLRRKLA